MRLNENSKTILSLAGVACLGFLFLVALLKLNSHPPKTDLEVYLDQIIRTADISDQYDWNGAGWDSQDVTDQVCDRVDVATLQSLGMSNKPIWPMPENGMQARPTYVWRVTQDKGLLESCRDHSIRGLRIVIDAETLVCTATVSPFPTCDM